MKVTSLLLAAFIVDLVQGFSSVQYAFGTRNAVTLRQETSIQMAKGFGAPKEPKREKSAAQIKREQEASKYDELAEQGGQEYNIFVRQFGSDDNSWFPCGSIAVPRGAQVTDAIYANEEALKAAIVRTYPKLEGFEAEFEFGFNLKMFSDDPVEVAVKGGPKSDGPSVGNWLNLLLSPIDATQAKNPNTK